MPTPHPARPPHLPGGAPGATDESLAARLRGARDADVAHATALLIARHRQAAHDYAVICLASSAHAADTVTTAAFHQVLDRLTRGEPAAALRPALLVAVRDTVRAWAADERISATLGVLRKPAGGRGMRAAHSMTPENRKLAERAFHSLPGPLRTLLWHIEVEAETADFAAALIGTDTDTATATAEQAREKFRRACARAHRELAPSDDCRFHNRLLDVPIRRGGGLLPDVQRHLDDCRHCRDAADQLGHFDDRLGILLTEAVLGWGARRYLDSRPGRTPHRPRARHAGRPRLDRVPGLAGRSSRALRAGVGIASAALLGTVLATALSSSDAGTDPAASSGATDGAVAPGAGPRTPPAPSSTPPGAARLPAGPPQTRLRSLPSRLCLGVAGEPRAGAGTQLAACSDDLTQRWSYETDGLLRSAADPGLCLDSRADAGVVVLGACADAGQARGGDVRYDLTARGELLPRRDVRLALSPTAAQTGADIVVRVRDGSPSQRWLTDPGPAASGSLSVAERAAPSARPAELTGGR